jgi:long-chain fatty acid transport protein
MSLNFQKPWQYRNIKLGDTKYEGKASAPIVPALFASYKKDRWAVSTMIGIVGSGGFVEYKEGVPQYNLMVKSVLGAIIPQLNQLPGINVPDDYTLDTEMKGKQYIYGGQLNLTYKVDDNWSVAAGIRANYYDGYNRGYVRASLPAYSSVYPGDLINLQLDCIQRGWGFAPIVSANYHNGPLTVAARYEFRTKISTENDTQKLIVGMSGQDTDVKALADMMGTEATVAALTPTLGSMAQKIEGYLPGENTRYDMPSLFVAAVGYEFTEKLRATLEYHFFDDKHAKMAGDRQKELKNGTHEIVAGVEYDINDKFTVSCGGQRTDYGLADGYQQNTSFACDSYSVGFGGAWNINEKIRLNAGYFMSIYSDYTTEPKAQIYGTPFTGTETYSRTNYVLGLGIDYKF